MSTTRPSVSPQGEQAGNLLALRLANAAGAVGTAPAAQPRPWVLRHEAPG